MGTIKYPENHDLRRLVRFSTEDGLIWLAENRMLLMHVASLSSLRKELIDSIGLDGARRILTRMGFASGQRDAELARKIRNDQSFMDAFMSGPQLHMLEGSVLVKPVKLEVDLESSHFYGEFIWEHSWEDEAHLSEYGQHAEPVCWMQIGYASGYTSSFLNRFVVFKEVECTACGTEHCRIVGKPIDEWEDAQELATYFEGPTILNQMLELKSQVDVLRSSIEQQDSFNLIGTSKSFRHAYELIRKAASTQVSVLLLGETGVGKERFARALHDASARRDKPFVAVNCAALPHDLIESELFGAEKGAFTGAHTSRIGKFERADGGTLFLDEIGELPLAAQAKLLRVLQEGEIERLGDVRTRKVNVRLIAATNVDLCAAVKEGRFRLDLYYRLNVYPVEIPPLRDRTADIPQLVEAMITKYATLHEKRISGITDKAMVGLKAYNWPGNIRELENMIERGVILTPVDGYIEIDHLHLSLDTQPLESGIGMKGQLDHAQADLHFSLCDTILASGLTMEQLEEMLMETSVNRASGNLSQAARMLGLTRPQLSYRLKRLNADKSEGDTSYTEH